MAGFSLRTEDDGMPGLLVNISVIVLHLLHDGVMDGSYGSSLLYGSVEDWFVVCHQDVVVPAACRDIFSGSQDTLSEDHSWKKNPLGP